MNRGLLSFKELSGLLTLAFFVLFCPIFFNADAAALEKKEIVVGTHLPLSGALESIGIEQRWAYETAVQDVNKNGGIFVKKYGKKLPVRLVIVDDKSDPGIAAASVERLAEEKEVDFILSGHSAVLGVIPGCIVSEKYRKYYHGTACFIPPWLEHNFNWSTIFFFDMYKAAMVPFKLLDTIDKNKRPSNLAILTEDTFDGRELARAIKEQGSKAGYDFVFESRLSNDTKDYTEQVKNAKRQNVDAILFYASTNELVNFVNQMKKNDFNVEFMYTWKGGWPYEFWEKLGQDAQYIISDGHWSQVYPFSGSKELGKRYYESSGHHSVGIGAFYAMCQILWQAIEKAGSLDSQKIRRAVIDNEFDTVMGPVDYNIKGIANYPPPAFQWLDGKQEILYPFNYTNRKVKLAPDWDRRLKNN
ncbi:MAG: amino acid ABC transporter substrate-binding protein [Desulfobacteraceae bacterium]|nr:amino acid ABC transporter substrate-binding protein [Desulfobacteraceae bacterium]